MADEPNKGTASTSDLVTLFSAIQGNRNVDEHTRKVVRDNAKLRELRTKQAGTIDELSARVKDLEGKVPGDGAVVLTGDAAKAYEAFTALGLKPDALKARLARADAADAEQAEAERVKAITDVVADAGYNGRLMAKLAKQEGFTVALTEQTVDGKKVSTPVAQKLGATGQPEGDALPLDDFAAEYLADYGAALRAPAPGTTTTTTAATVPAVVNGGTVASPSQTAVRRPGVAMHVQAGAGASGGTTREQVVSTKRADPMYAIL